MPQSVFVCSVDLRVRNNFAMKPFLICVSIVILAYTVLSQECGKDYGDKEPNEGDANLKQYPSIGTITFLQENGQYRFNGKATLIAPHYALTTAVNVEYKVAKPINILFGNQNIFTAVDCSPEDPKNCSPNPVVAEIDKIFPHPNHDIKSHDNDIAVIKLKEDVSFSEYIQPICLPEKNELTEDGENLYFCTYSNAGIFSDKEKGIRRTVIVPQRNIDLCAEAYKFKSIISSTETKMCAGSEGRDGCAGDGGAALMRRNKASGRWTALGLMSFGNSKCGEADYPSIYTKLSKYVDWIDSVIKSE